ncbi:UNKNOWN [Stylonychia lemnae]|uniref:Leucine Rich Repeat family protein n=1 Tax=Stylonychia lemnae TaxID=5949 RepID=A0A078AAK6_STYLE|nr:UNKNOWN [Stylonychia lemnae]|eukprot:CDW79310.1 UNKNOWN [Stylonychia lemnae]
MNPKFNNFTVEVVQLDQHSDKKDEEFEFNMANDLDEDEGLNDTKRMLVQLKDQRRNTNRKFTHEIQEIRKREISKGIKEPMTPNVNTRRIDQHKEVRFSNLDNKKDGSEHKARQSITSQSKNISPSPLIPRRAPQSKQSQSVVEAYKEKYREYSYRGSIIATNSIRKPSKFIMNQETRAMAQRRQESQNQEGFINKFREQFRQQSFMQNHEGNLEKDQEVRLQFQRTILGDQMKSQNHQSSDHKEIHVEDSFTEESKLTEDPSGEESKTATQQQDYNQAEGEDIPLRNRITFNPPQVAPLDSQRFKNLKVETAVNKVTRQPSNPGIRKRNSNIGLTSPIKLGKSLYHIEGKNENKQEDERKVTLKNTSIMIEKFKIQRDESIKRKRQRVSHENKKTSNNKVTNDENLTTANEEEKIGSQSRYVKSKFSKRIEDPQTNSLSVSKQTPILISHHTPSAQFMFTTRKTLNLYTEHGKKSSGYTVNGVKQYESKSNPSLIQFGPNSSSHMVSSLNQPNIEKPKEEQFKGVFTIDRKRPPNVRIFSNKVVTDETLCELLLYLETENVTTISMPNCKLYDAGLSILFEFLLAIKNLQRLKVCNNIMQLFPKEMPFLESATYIMGLALKQQKNLQVFELHGFFFKQDDYETLFEGLSSCHQLKQLTFSNNGLQDYGVEYISQLIEDPRMNIKQMTLMNNQLMDEGAEFLADAIQSEYCKLEKLDLKLNFIKDKGAALFVDGKLSD